MGTVYLCEDLRLPGKVWAVKEMMLPEALPELALERFQREVQLLSRLRHPSLPMIADCFREDGQEYLVMEFVEGETLAALLERDGPVDEVQALRWAVDMARVLEYLHTCEPKIIFSDLKPENILVTPGSLSSEPPFRPPGGGKPLGQLKLIDFGLARHLVPDEKKAENPGWGSVGYSPPEQWEGEGRTDERSDLYSLGATVFYLLTARHPSPVYGSNRVATHRPEVGADLDAWVARLMEAAPQKRPASAAQAAREAQELLAARGVFEETGRTVFRKRHKQSYSRWLALTAMLLLVVLSGIAAWQARRAGPPPTQDPRLTLAQAAAREGHSEKALAILEELLRTRPEDAEGQLLRENLRALRSGENALRVPVITSLTGIDGPDGYPILYGMVLAQRDINAQGGLAGRPLVLDLFDDGSDSNKALAISHELVANPAYLLALGPFTSQRALQVGPLFNAHHLTLLAPSASDPRLWQSGPYLMTVADTNHERIEALARHFVKQGLRRGAILADQTVILSNSFAQSFLAACEAAGGQIVAQLDYQGGESDFRTQVDQIVASKAQFVFQADFRGSEVLRFVRALRQSGSTIPVATQLAIHAPGFLKEGGSEVEGVLTASYFHPEADVPEVQQFMEKFSAAYPKTRASHVSAGAYDALQAGARALKEALTEGGSPVEQRERVREALYGMDIVSGVSGRFAPGRKLDLRETYVIEVRDGAFRLVR